MRHWTSGRTGTDENVKLPPKPPVRLNRVSVIMCFLCCRFGSFQVGFVIYDGFLMTRDCYLLRCLEISWDALNHPRCSLFDSFTASSELSSHCACSRHPATHLAVRVRPVRQISPPSRSQIASAVRHALTMVRFRSVQRFVLYCTHTHISSLMYTSVSDQLSAVRNVPQRRHRRYAHNARTHNSF